MTNGNPSAGSGTNNGSDRLDLLTDQIGRLTEQIAQSNITIVNGFAETRANIEKLGEKIDSGFSELKAIAQSQQQDINRLVEVTDKLVDTTARQEQDINRLVEVTDRQAKMVDRQAQTVDCLALMLEKLMSDSR